MKNYFNKTILVLVLSFFTSTLFAQKVEFEALEIIYGDIAKGANGVRSFKGNLVFSENTTLEIVSGLSIKKDIGDVKVKITLSGYDKKLNKFSTSLDWTYSAKGKNNRSKLNIKPTDGNEIYINEITISATDSKNNTTTATRPIFADSKKTVFAILLNGIDSDDLCNTPKQNHVFMNQSLTTKYAGIVIALNNTKKEAPQNIAAGLDIEEALTKGLGSASGIFIWKSSNNKQTTNIVKPSTDQNGNVTFKDSMPVTKEAPVLVSFQLAYITVCNDTFNFYSVYKEKLNDKKTWDYKVKMIEESVIATENPVFQPANGTFNNVMLLTIPASTISIDGGNFIIKDNAQLNMLLSNTGNGTFDTTNISSVSFSMQMAEGDRVFYHWGSTVSTSNPKINTNFDTTLFGAVSIVSMEIRVVDNKKDTTIFLFESNLNTSKYGLALDNKNYIVVLKKTEKLKYKNPCDTKFKLKEITYSETTVGDLYALQVSFQLEQNSDLPTQMAMMAEIKDCNGTNQYIRINLNYDAKTNTYTGSQTLSQPRNCNFELVYGEIAAYNECKDKTVWSFQTDQSKSNGSGTRNVATTTSGKPGLL